MFNLTVSEAHTFYVGQNGWLVHNASGGCPALLDDAYHPTGPNGPASRQATWDAMRASGYLSPNQINKMIQTGKAPPGLTRVDTGKIKGEQTHVHFSDDSALNIDGTWKHKAKGFGELTKEQEEFLKDNGWTLPK